jgi:LmbE family N-acetylglucosaminyl deacetylase
VLAVCAHPDDESFGLGAVLRQFITDGAEVAMLCFTHGEASSLGGSDRPLSEIRSAELAGAATALGIGRTKLLDRPDGSLAEEFLEDLADEVAAMVDEVRADLLLVFDEGGVTGHPDHHRATEAALAGAPARPVLAWSLPSDVAEALNAEFGAIFVGRNADEIDVVVRVDRTRQRQAIACHTSQSSDNRVLWRRLELLGDEESLRWLRRPASHQLSSVGYPSDSLPMSLDDRLAAIAEEWDRRYASAPQVFRAEPDESLVELVSPLPPGTAIDLGAGEGRNSLWLARRGWNVVAVDASRVALDRLSDAAEVEGLSIKTVADDLISYLANVRVAGTTFGLVVLAYVHPDPSGRAELLTAAAHSLSAGGHLFVVGHHVSSLGVTGPPDPARLYTEDDLREIPGLDVIRLEQRRGKSDVSEPGTDVVLWARRRATDRESPSSTATKAS